MIRVAPQTVDESDIDAWHRKTERWLNEGFEGKRPSKNEYGEMLDSLIGETEDADELTFLGELKRDPFISGVDHARKPERGGLSR